MMKKNKIVCKYFSLIIILFLMVFPLINAFSVSYPYTKDRPFIIGPGQAGEFEMQLQSSSADKTENIKVEILEGMEIIGIDKDEYQVKPQQLVNFKVRANIPQEAPELTEYKILMKFSAVSSTENQGTLSFDKSYTIGFNVLVKTSESPIIVEPEKSNNAIWWILIIIILLAIVLVLYLYSKQKKGSTKRK